MLTNPQAVIAGNNIQVSAITDASTGVLSAVLALADAPLFGPGMIAAAQFNDFSAGLGDRFQFSGERYVRDMYGRWVLVNEAVPEGSRMWGNLLSGLNWIEQDVTIEDEQGVGPGATILAGNLTAGETGSLRIQTNVSGGVAGQKVVTTIELAAADAADVGKTVHVRAKRAFGGASVSVGVDYVLTADFERIPVPAITGLADNAQWRVMVYQGGSGTPATRVKAQSVMVQPITYKPNELPDEFTDKALTWSRTTNPCRVVDGLVVSDVPQVQLPARRIENALHADRTEAGNTPYNLDQWSKYFPGEFTVTGGHPDPDGGNRAFKIVCNDSTWLLTADFDQALNFTGKYFSNRVWLRGESGGETVRFAMRDNQSKGNDIPAHTVTSQWGEYGGIVQYTHADGECGLQLRHLAGDGAATFYIYEPMPVAFDELPAGLPPRFDDFGYSEYEYNAVVDANGVVTIQQGPRIEAVQGIRLGGPQENLFAAPNDMSDPAWTRPRLDVAVDDGWQVLTPTTETGAHFAYQDKSIAGSAKYTLSAEAIPNGYDWVQITGSTGFETKWANINVRTGEIGEASASLGTANVRAELQDDGSCLVVYTDESHTSPDPAAVNRLLFSVLDSDRAARIPSYAGDGTSGVKVRNLKFAKKAYYDGYNEGVTPGAILQQTLNVGLVNDFHIDLEFTILHSVDGANDYNRPFSLFADADNRIEFYLRNPGDDRIGFFKQAGGVGQYLNPPLGAMDYQANDRFRLQMWQSSQTGVRYVISKNGLEVADMSNASFVLGAAIPMTNLHIACGYDGGRNTDLIVHKCNITDPDGHIINALSQPITTPGIQSGLTFTKPANDDYQVMLSDGASVVSALAQALQAASSNHSVNARRRRAAAILR